MLRDRYEVLRRELQHERHDAEVGVELLQRRLRVLGFQARELEHRDALLLGRNPECVRPGAGLFRRAKNARDLVATREKRFQHRLAEVLLPDDRELHAAFFGGTLNAPAFLRLVILPAS